MICTLLTGLSGKEDTYHLMSGSFCMKFISGLPSVIRVRRIFFRDAVKSLEDKAAHCFIFYLILLIASCISFGSGASRLMISSVTGCLNDSEQA